MEGRVAVGLRIFVEPPPHRVWGHWRHCSDPESNTWISHGQWPEQSRSLGLYWMPTQETQSAKVLWLVLVLNHSHFTPLQDGYALARFLHDNCFKSAADRDSAGWSPLCYAAIKGDTALVKALLENKADANDHLTKKKKEHYKLVSTGNPKTGKNGWKKTPSMVPTGKTL